MLATTKSLSLIEQKRLQWAKEKEEMVGLYGLWGRPRNGIKSETNQISLNNKTNLLPPIQTSSEIEEPTKEPYRLEEESETSGYLSDSPKHINERGGDSQDHQYPQPDEQLNNEETKQFWSEVDKSENYWADRKMYKNYKNENWAHHNSESYITQNSRSYQSNKNFWYGTPESASSDDGSRLRWGDRGVGVGHLWEPVINVPDCRLPQVSDPYRQTPKWVEKGLKNADGNKADILIIHHPDDEQYHQQQKNFLLGQNAPIPPEVIEERERRRKKALEHQNAIKKQLEERELKRKQERENRLREEKLEEERIKKEQEIERKRYEEEQRKLKEKEELERKKEEAMREAIKEAERRAREEKRRSKRQIPNEIKNNLEIEKPEKLEKIAESEQLDNNLNNRKNYSNTPRYRKGEGNHQKAKKEQTEKSLKDSSSQFEEIQLANNFQFLNMNGVPVDGGLALMLDNPPKDNNFLLPPDGVQLALLMSPRSAGTANCLIPGSPPVLNAINAGERVLTPSKYRLSERMRYHPSNKSTQTDFKASTWMKPYSSGLKSRKQIRSALNSGSSGASQKRVIAERHSKHIRSFIGSKHRSKQISSKINLEDRPKWGINRPSVQYKKQSEKDPYYQKKMKERLKKAVEIKNMSSLDRERARNDEEKELKSIVSFIECPSDEENVKQDCLLNGYRMNSNLSSPVFVPIGKRLPSDEKQENETERSESKGYMSGENEEMEEEEEEEEEDEDEDEEDDDDEDTVVPGSVGFLTQTQLEAIKQIANLREGLKKLQKDYSNSRSITPFSDVSVEK